MEFQLGIQTWQTFSKKKLRKYWNLHFILRISKFLIRKVINNFHDSWIVTFCSCSDPTSDVNVLNISWTTRQKMSHAILKVQEMKYQCIFALSTSTLNYNYYPEWPGITYETSVFPLSQLRIYRQIYVCSVGSVSSRSKHDFIRDLSIWV